MKYLIAVIVSILIACSIVAVLNTLQVRTDYPIDKYAYDYLINLKTEKIKQVQIFGSLPKNKEFDRVITDRRLLEKLVAIIKNKKEFRIEKQCANVSRTHTVLFILKDGSYMNIYLNLDEQDSPIISPCLRSIELKKLLIGPTEERR